MKIGKKIKPKTVSQLPQDFASVAKRLECDPDLKKFDAKLKKLAKADLTKAKK